jgi:iron complex outermembrane receptor protein
VTFTSTLTSFARAFVPLFIVSGAANAASPATTEGDSAAVEEVIVTGSRLITNSNESPTPVTVVGMDQLLQANPGNLVTALSMIPALLATPNGGGQSATLFQSVFNVRGMGAQRNLVMFDGHRLQATTGAGNNNGVDSNLIPNMLLKRVDVVTGGASAVYGSDAISGVINYIVDNNFNGVMVNLQGSRTAYGDNESYNLGVAAGTSLFNGRGHIEFSAQRIHDPGIPDRFARQWGRRVNSTQGSVIGSTANAGTVANPYYLIENSRFGITNFAGVIGNGPLAGLQFAQNGVLSPFVNGAPTGTPVLAKGGTTIQIGGDGGYFNTYAAMGLTRQDLGFGRYDFSITDDTKFYVEVAAGAVLNYNQLENTEVRSRLIGYRNPYLASVQDPYRTTIAAQLAAAPLGTFQFSRLFTTDQFPSQVNSARGTQQLYLSGLEGSLGRYKWNIGYGYQTSKLRTSNPNNISNPRLFAAMDAVTVTAANVGSSGLPLGSIACNARLVNPSAYGGCVPLNLFGPTASDPAVFNYINAPTSDSINGTLNDVTASIAGSPFESWAGPVDMAVSGNWRESTYEIESNYATTDPVNCTGIQFNCVQTGTTATTPYFTSVSNPFPRASATVAELAFETQVPLLTDKFLARSLAFNGAARYTDYSVSGIVWTWKGGLTWSPSDSLTFRATRSRDIRAPNVGQLFAPPNCTNNTLTDLHTGATITVPSCNVGNPNLTPEKADTLSFGVIWTPQFIDGLFVSVDHYNIEVTDTLNTTNSTQQPAQSICENSGGTAPICASYIRPLPFSDRSAANNATRIDNFTLNTGSLKDQGVDTEISYTRSLFGRKFNSRLLVNFQPVLFFDLGPSGVYFAAGAANSLPGLNQTPNVKALLQLNYEVFDGFTVTGQQRYRNALKQTGSPDLNFAVGKVPAQTYTDMTLNYKKTLDSGSDLHLFLNVRNVFNTPPDPWASVGGNARFNSLGGYSLGDDILGRFYTAGLRYKF